MNKILLLIGLTLFSFSSAQTEKVEDVTEQYGILLNGDTIHGHIKHKGSQGELKTKITCKVNDTLKYTWKPKDLKYFRVGKDEYITFQPEGAQAIQFVRIWVKGYIELYEWEAPEEEGGGFYPYIRKRGETNFTEVDIKYWKDQIAEIIATDNEEMAEKMYKGKHKLEDLDMIIQDFNDWKEEEEDK